MGSHPPSVTASPSKSVTRCPSNTVRMYQRKTVKMFPGKSAIMFLRESVTQSTKMSAPPTTSRSPSMNLRKNVRLFKSRLRGRCLEKCVTLYLRRIVRKYLPQTLSTRMRQSAMKLQNNSALKYLENLVTITDKFYNFYITNLFYDFDVLSY